MDALKTFITFRFQAIDASVQLFSQTKFSNLGRVLQPHNGTSGSSIFSSINTENRILMSVLFDFGEYL